MFLPSNVVNSSLASNHRLSNRCHPMRLKGMDDFMPPGSQWPCLHAIKVGVSNWEAGWNWRVILFKWWWGLHLSLQIQENLNNKHIINFPETKGLQNRDFLRKGYMSCMCMLCLYRRESTKGRCYFSQDHTDWIDQNIQTIEICEKKYWLFDLLRVWLNIFTVKWKWPKWLLILKSN